MARNRELSLPAPSMLCFAKGRNLDAALQAAGQAALGDRDRSLAGALAYGAARTHLRNRLIIEQLASRPFRPRDSVIVALISVGIFALTESRRPDYAVVSATVEAAVLRGQETTEARRKCAAAPIPA